MPGSVKYVHSLHRMMSQDDTNKNNGVEEEHPVDKIFGLKDPNALSAFEVYNIRSHQQSNNNNINNTKQKAVTNTISNPIRLVQGAARTFGLTVLSSELEKIRYLYSHSHLMSLFHFALGLFQIVHGCLSVMLVYCRCKSNVVRLKRAHMRHHIET
jgi:hypothetical protein